jgi:RNA recognition motif-containing protein
MSKNLYVGNLSYGVTEEDLKKTLKKRPRRL